MVQHEEFWNDSHLFMIAQDKYMTVYTATSTEHLLNYIVDRPSPKIKMAKKSLTEQAYQVVFFSEYNKASPEDSSATKHTSEDNADYWNNLDDVELYNIENMMEGYAIIIGTRNIQPSRHSDKPEASKQVSIQTSQKHPNVSKAT